MRRIKQHFNSTAMAAAIAFLCLLSSCVSTRQPNYKFNQKYAAADLKQDFTLLQNILQANHPSLYWYTSKDSIDYYFSTAINSITDSLTELQFRNKVGNAISKIHCGHTAVRMSDAFYKQADKHRFPQFPLFLKTWGDSLVVLGNMFSKDSVLKRGTVITSINGKTNRQLLDSIFDIMSTDGYSENFKSQTLTNNFPAWYRSVYGLDSQYVVKYIDTTGNEVTTIIKNYQQPKPDSTLKKELAKKLPKIKGPSRRERKKAERLNKRSLLIDSTTNTAFIRLTTFSSGNLRRFFRKSFKTIKQQNIQNLVIDLRENGGGSVALSTKLSRYLVDKPFKIGDTVAATNRKLNYSKCIKGSWGYWVAMNFFASKHQDGRIHFNRYERHLFNPCTNNHFNGNVYLIQGGVTFSAATMFISNLKGQKNVTVVGEETGGGYYGNSAMLLPKIVLPHTKLRITLPLYRLVIDKDRTKNGRGVMPDIYIPPSSQAIKKGYDIKILTVKELIQKKN